MSPPGPTNGAPEKEVSPGASQCAKADKASHDTTTKTQITAIDRELASRQVNWSVTHDFLEAALAQANAGPLPWAGTPAWVALSDHDPRKLLALAVAGEHHVLRVEVAQTARADASRAVAAVANWSETARDMLTRNSFYCERPWLKRAAS